ncbi:MAG TPA: T9SS type A sorting domain-containing protein [Bacteroidota bacterium]|nr:T9SS type A sorting domain-containing protein [Bacteroidota bacterium]
MRNANGLLVLRLSLAAVLMFSLPLFGQSTKPLEGILRSDGSLDLSGHTNGSFDPQGYRMVLTPSGQPRFIPATQSSSHPDDQYWVDEWYAPGGGPRTQVIAKSGSNMYIGGYFGYTGNVPANGFARFDGIRWSTVGGSITPFTDVKAIAVYNGDIYMGGSFTDVAGDTSIKYLARWNGSSWVNAGAGIRGGYVYALAVWNNELYVGGDFVSAGGLPIKKLAKWNGSAWDSLATLTSGSSTTLPYVMALHVANNKLYIGGRFEKIGGKLMNNIAVFNGTSFDSLGVKPNVGIIGLSVRAIATIGTDVYVGGDFTQAGPLAVNSIAKWTGSAWDSLSNGLTYYWNGSFVRGWCHALATIGSDLYVAGIFGRAGHNAPAASLAKWNGSNWSTVGAVTSTNYNAGETLHALYADGTDLYVGGDYRELAGVGLPGIGRWDGNRWYTLGNGAPLFTNSNGAPNAIVIDGNDVIIGGAFGSIGGVGGSIARWDGAKWNGYGTPVNYTLIHAVALSNGKLYVAGEFSSIGGISANNIAVWNGSSWSALGSGLNSAVRAIAVKNDTVYAGGYFTEAGGNSTNFIARWDGSAWNALGSGVNNYVLALAFMGSDLYAGGFFTRAGGSIVNYIARWDGTNWSALTVGTSTGLTTAPNSLFSRAGMLYVGGSFSTVAGVTANGIVGWDGTNWVYFADGLKYLTFGAGTIYAIGLRGSDLIAGGSFAHILPSGDTLRNVAIWNGAAWTGLGSGIDGTWGIYGLAVKNNDLWFVGPFTMAGGKYSNGIAVWNKPVTAPLAPTLVFPPNDSTGLYITTTFRWQPSGDATLYELQVSTDSLFATTIIHDSSIVGVSRRLQNLTASTRLFWRVRGVNSAGVGPWSAVRRFTTTVAPPAAPILQSPSHNSTNHTTRTTFQWTFPAGASFFHLQVSTDSTFLQSFSISTNDSTLTTTSKDVSLNTSTRYFWRVRAKNAGGWSGWSAVFVLTTANLQAPFPPTLISPADAATGQPTTITFSWGSSSNTTFYRLQVSVDSLFATTFTNDSVTTTAKQVAGLSGGTQYFWRVNANNSGGASFWSTVRSFTTQATTGIVAEEGIPTEFALQQNFPNPFNPATTIRYDLPQSTNVKLAIYNLLGQAVAELVNEEQGAGRYRIEWRPNNHPSGVYFYRLEAGSFVAIRKLVFVK